MLNVSISVYGVETMAYFKAWDGECNEVILGMAWLLKMNVWITYNEGVMYRKLKDGKTLANVPILTHL